MRISDWSSDVCSSDLLPTAIGEPSEAKDHPPLVRSLDGVRQLARIDHTIMAWLGLPFALRDRGLSATPMPCLAGGAKAFRLKRRPGVDDWLAATRGVERAACDGLARLHRLERRSEEHTSELQSLMRTSYAV